MNSQVSIYIDNTQVEIDNQTKVTLSATFASAIANVTPQRSIERLSLPATNHNRQVMGWCEQMAAEVFNATEHTIVVSMDDRTVIKGTPILHSVQHSSDGVRYIIDVQVDNSSWRETVGERTIDELSFELNKTIDAQSVTESWSEEQALVRFLPVCRKAIDTEQASAEVVEVTKPLAADDYHPFIHLRTVVRRIFEDADYKLESEFMDSEEFGSLYLSGAYPEGDATELERRMGFRARRNETQTTTADYAGCVYASPLNTTHSVGNPVDVDSYGKFNDTYNRNFCLQLTNGRLTWVPTREVTVGFVYELRYRTDCRILSRERLAGFDKVWLDDTTCHSFKIANPYTDHRENPIAGFRYRAVVFEAGESDSFRIVYTLDGVQKSSEVLIGSNNEIVFGSSGQSLAIIRLEKVVNNSYKEWSGDWALYAGYVGNGGTMDVAITLRSAPETITPSKPKYLDRLIMGGADEGMALRWEAGTSIRPVFYSYTVDGAQVGWSDIAAMKYAQSDIIDSVCGMFNLKITEDSAKKIVRIEQTDNLLSHAEVVDWQGRILRDNGITVSDTAIGLPRKMVLAYSKKDSATRDWNKLTGEEFGRWEFEIGASKSATEQKEVAQVIFSPSLNVDGTFIEAPEASTIKVGNAAADEQPTIEQLNFPIKIVRYFGTKPLADGHRWGWPSYGSEYPYAAFHAPELQATLCFENRDGADGLNTHYTRSARLWNTSKKLTAHIRLMPHEAAELLDYATEQKPSERLYQLGVDNETDLYTLDNVEGISPDGLLAKCHFTKIS